MFKYYFCECLFIVIIQTQTQAKEYFFNQTIYAESQRNLIIESDEPDINKITSINYDLIEKTFTIDYFEKATILQVITLNSIHFKTELAFCMCQLFESNQKQYFITCIDGIHIDYKNNITNQLENAKKYNISLTQPNSQQCNDMYVSDLNQIDIVCHSKEELIIYSIDLFRQNSLIIKEKLNHSKEGCLRKIISFENSQLLVFHNCEVWEIFEIKTQNITLFLDKKILDNSNFGLEVNLLTEIAVCQKTIYLIEENSYKSWQKQNEFLLWKNISQISKPIIKIIFNSKCHIEIIVSKSKDGDQIQFIKEDQTIQIRDDENNTEIFHTKQYLILKKQSQVKVIITQFLEQNYQLLSSSLKFHEIKQENNLIIKFVPDLYYQMNPLTKKIQFYRFRKFKQYLHISKKYIYDFQNINLFTELDQHFRTKTKILDKNNYEKSIQNELIEMNINNKCQNTDQFKIIKNLYGIPLNQEFEIIHNNNNIIYDITDETDQSEICPNYNFEIVSQIIWVGMQDQIIFVFIVDDILQILNCKTYQILCAINIKNKLVFEYKGYIYLFELKQKQYEYLLFYEEQCLINKFQFQGEVQDVKQFQSNLIIKVSNKILILNMIINSYKQMELMYNSVIPKFYFEQFEYSNIYQQNQILFIKKPTHKAIYLIEIDLDYQIIHAQISYKGFFFIGVHDSSNSIKFYFLDEDLITQSQQIHLDEYQIIKPFKYQASNSHLMLAAITNLGQKVFLIFKIGTSLELIDVRVTENLNSYLQVQGFFYFNKQKKLRCLNLNYYTIKLKLDLRQANLFDSYSQKLNAYLKSSISLSPIQADIKINVINNCYNVLPLHNTIIILNTENDNNITILNERDYFVGPINQITIIENQSYQIQGPFLLKESKIYQSKVFNISLKGDSEFLAYQNIQMKCLVIDKESQFNLQFCNILDNYFIGQIIDYFYLEAEKLLVLFINDIHQSKIYVLQFDELKNVFFQTQDTIIYYKQGLFKNILKVRKYKSDFFLLKEVYGSELQYHQYTFQNNNYSDFMIHANFIDMIHVENSDNYHISLSAHGSSNIYIFEIMQSTSQSSRIIKQLNIDVILLTKDFVFGDYFQVTQKSIKCFLSSYLVNNTLAATFFFYTQQLSFEIEFRYYLKNDEYNFRINKIFRNPIPYSDVNVQYYDEQILILRDSYQNYYRYFLYDLRLSSSMYDYIYSFEDYKFKLLKFNNTAYFLQQTNNESFIFLEIGYLIEMKKNTQEIIELRASNQISNASFEFIFSKTDKTNNDQLTNELKFLLYLLMILFSFIIVFLIRRKQKLSDQLQNQISFDRRI